MKTKTAIAMMVMFVIALALPMLTAAQTETEKIIGIEVEYTNSSATAKDYFIVYNGHPVTAVSYNGPEIELISNKGEKLLQYTISDPRIIYDGGGAPILENVTDILILPFLTQVTTANIYDQESKKLLGSIDLSQPIYDFCRKRSFNDPDCQLRDTDNDGILDKDEPDSDGDGIMDDLDACKNDTFNDIDGDGLCGDVDNCPQKANPDQKDSNKDGFGDVCQRDFHLHKITNAPDIYGIQGIVRSPDGKILHAVFDDTHNVRYVQSADDGKTWTVPINISTGSPLDEPQKHGRDMVQEEIDVSPDGTLWARWLWVPDFYPELHPIYFRSCKSDCTNPASWSSFVRMDRRGYMRSGYAYNEFDVGDDGKLYYIESASNSNSSNLSTYEVNMLFCDTKFENCLDASRWKEVRLTDNNVEENFPQITSTPDGNLHVVYSRILTERIAADKDVVPGEIFYRECDARNTDCSQLQRWSAELDVGQGLVPRIAGSPVGSTVHVIKYNDNDRISEGRIYYKKCTGGCANAGRWTDDIYTGASIGAQVSLGTHTQVAADSIGNAHLFYQPSDKFAYIFLKNNAPQQPITIDSIDAPNAAHALGVMRKAKPARSSRETLEVRYLKNREVWHAIRVLEGPDFGEEFNQTALQPPEITINSPEAKQYSYTAEFTIDFTVNSSASLAEKTATVDGTEVSAGDSIALHDFSVGEHTFTVKAKDVNGLSAENKATFTVIDDVAPLTLNDAVDAWSNKDQTVSLFPTDEKSAIKSTKYCIASEPSCSPNTEGTTAAISCLNGELCINYVGYYSTDFYSNVEPTTYTLWVRTDKQPPKSTASGFDSEWHNKEVVITVNADDAAGSGLAEVYYVLYEDSVASPIMTTDIDGPITITHESDNNIVEYWAVDYAGNEEQRRRIEGIKLDKTAPITTDDASSEWSGEDVAVKLSAIDKLSGVAKTLYCIDDNDTCEPNLEGNEALVTCEPGSVCTKYVRYNSIDAAGNVEEVKTSAVVRIDKQKPATVTDYIDAWRTSDFYINLKADDNGGSGVNSTAYEITEGGNVRTGDVAVDGQPLFAYEDDSSSLSYKSEDNVGNLEDVKTITGIKLDKTKPVTTASGYDAEWHNTPYEIILNAEDPRVQGNPSGIKEVFYQFYDDEAGQGIKSVSSKDKAIVAYQDDDNWLEYFSKDVAANEEGHRIIKQLKLDTQKPNAIILQPVEGGEYLNTEKLPLKYDSEDVKVQGMPSGTKSIQWFVNGNEVADPTDIKGLVCGEHELKLRTKDFADNINEASVKFKVVYNMPINITPKALKVNPGVITVHLQWPDAIKQKSQVKSATLDGAAQDKILPDQIRFRRVDVEAALKPKAVDTHFVLTGTMTYNGKNCLFKGEGDIEKVLAS